MKRKKEPRSVTLTECQSGRRSAEWTPGSRAFVFCGIWMPLAIAGIGLSILSWIATTKTLPATGHAPGDYATPYIFNVYCMFVPIVSGLLLGLVSLLGYTVVRGRSARIVTLVLVAFLVNILTLWACLFAFVFAVITAPMYASSRAALQQTAQLAGAECITSPSVNVAKQYAGRRPVARRYQRRWEEQHD